VTVAPSSIVSVTVQFLLYDRLATSLFAPPLAMVGSPDISGIVEVLLQTRVGADSTGR